MKMLHLKMLKQKRFDLSKKNMEYKFPHCFILRLENITFWLVKTVVSNEEN